MQLILLANFVNAIACANILGVFTSPYVSHQAVYGAIWRELSLKGHNVTVLTPYPLNDHRLTNLTEIDLGFSIEIQKQANVVSAISKELPITTVLSNIYEYKGSVAAAQLSHPPVQVLINDRTRHFDVMLIESLHPLMYALSAKFNCPFIGISSLPVFIPGHDAVGNPVHPVLNPDILMPFINDKHFFDRLYSTFAVVWYRLYYAYSIIPRQDEVARRYVSDKIPYLGHIEKNMSLLFVNVNPIVHVVRPNVPAIIELWNVYIKKNNQLPADLQEELDNAEHGVVYFSLGSNVRSASLSTELLQEIILALSELPYKVLFKWEDDSLLNKPKNFVTRKWFPQQDVLSHKNIKVFITQGGLQSIEEAIYHCVPLVVLPFFGDQPLNAARIAKLGIAITIDFTTLTRDELQRAIIEVAENVSYRDAIKKVSELTKDVPMTGLEKAVWWVEYVIRHKGAAHLRSPAVDIPWYEYLLLDVVGFVLVSFIILVYITYKVIYFVIHLLRKIFAQTKVKVS